MGFILWKFGYDHWSMSRLLEKAVWSLSWNSLGLFFYYGMLTIYRICISIYLNVMLLLLLLLMMMIVLTNYGLMINRSASVQPREWTLQPWGIYVLFSSDEFNYSKLTSLTHLDLENQESCTPAKIAEGSAEISVSMELKARSEASHS